MTRPLRLEFAGALYHVTVRGNRLGAIFHDDADRREWLRLLRVCCERFAFRVYAYCQMTNHFHIVLETSEANLSRGMQHLNGRYSQHVNRHHKLVGHVFQGRYHAVLVQKESYLLELARYVVLNPVRAGMVASANDWDWSSHHWLAEQRNAPPWFDGDWLLGHFGKSRSQARSSYRQFVQDGEQSASPFARATHQCILGDDEFVAAHTRKVNPETLRDVTKTQRRQLLMSLPAYQATYCQRDEAMARAFWSTAFTMADIGSHFGVSYKTVSRAVSRHEAALTSERFG